jgi:hypothetical protein
MRALLTHSKAEQAPSESLFVQMRRMNGPSSLTIRIVPDKMRISECIRTRQLDAASLNFH